MDSWQHKDEKTKVEKKKYGISIEKFNWACQLYQVPQSEMREAFSYASLFAKSAEEAADMIMIENRKRAWGKNKNK